MPVCFVIDTLQKIAVVQFTENFLPLFVSNFVTIHCKLALECLITRYHHRLDQTCTLSQQAHPNTLSTAHIFNLDLREDLTSFVLPKLVVPL